MQVSSSEIFLVWFSLLLDFGPLLISLSLRDQEAVICILIDFSIKNSLFSLTEGTINISPLSYFTIQSGGDSTVIKR